MQQWRTRISKQVYLLINQHSLSCKERESGNVDVWRKIKLNFLFCCLFSFFHESQLHMHSLGAITFVKKTKFSETEFYSYMTYYSD